MILLLPAAFAAPIDDWNSSDLSVRAVTLVSTTASGIRVTDTYSAALVNLDGATFTGVVATLASSPPPGVAVSDATLSFGDVGPYNIRPGDTFSVTYPRARQALARAWLGRTLAWSFTGEEELVLAVDLLPYDELDLEGCSAGGGSVLCVGVDWFDSALAEADVGDVLYTVAEPTVAEATGAAILPAWEVTSTTPVVIEDDPTTAHDESVSSRLLVDYVEAYRLLDYVSSGIVETTGAQATDCDTTSGCDSTPEDGLTLHVNDLELGSGLAFSGQIGVRDLDVYARVKMRALTLRRAEVGASLDWTAALQLSAEADASAAGEAELYSIPVVTAAPPGVPIVITVSAGLFVGYEADLAASSTFGVYQDGVTTWATGWEDGVYYADTTALPDPNGLTTPRLDASVAASARAWAGLDLTATLDYVLEGSIRAAPYVEAGFDTGAGEWSIGTGFQCDGAVDLSPFGVEVAGWDFDLGSTELDADGGVADPEEAFTAEADAWADVLQRGTSSRVYGGTITALADGGALIQYSTTDFDCIRLSPEGEVMWAISGGLDASDEDAGLVELADGHILLFGLARSTEDVQFTEIDADGVVVHAERWLLDDAVALQVELLPDGTLALLARNTRDSTLYHLEWTSGVGATFLASTDYASTGSYLQLEGLAQVEGDLLLAGWTDADPFTERGDTGYDTVLLRVAPAGDLVWARAAGGDNHDQCNGVAANDGVIVSACNVGYKRDTNAFLVLAHDADGNFLWQRGLSDDVDLLDAQGESAPYASGRSTGDEARDVAVAGDAFVVAGFADGSYEDAWLTSIDGEGRVRWMVTTEGSGRELYRDVVCSEDSCLAMGWDDTLTGGVEAVLLAKVPTNGGLHLPDSPSTRYLTPYNFTMSTTDDGGNFLSVGELPVTVTSLADPPASAYSVRAFADVTSEVTSAYRRY